MLTPDMQAAFVSILKEELVPATGCTEPIAIAYCAAKMRQVLGALPEKVLVEVSGNILKNAKSVVVPNTGGMKGVQAAAAAGIVSGQADQELQVISSVPESAHAGIAAFVKNTPIQVACPETPWLLDIQITGWAGSDKAVVHILDSHTNIVYIEKNGVVELKKEMDAAPGETGGSRELLTLKKCAGLRQRSRPVAGVRFAGPPDPVQFCHRRGRAEKQLGRQYWLHFAEGVRRRH